MMTEIFKGAVQLSPLLFLTIFSFVPLTLKILNKNKEPSPVLVVGMGVLALASSLFLLLALGFRGNEIFSLRFDLYGSGACVLVALSALHSFPLFIWNRDLDKTQLSEIVFLFLNGVSALYVFSLAKDLVTGFIGLEVASLVIYILISMSRRASLSLEAGIKYFVLSSFSGIIFLYGLSFLFGVTGDLSFSELSKQTETFSQFNRFFYLGFIFIFAGLFFKVALFPFHFWLADVYEGALTPMTSFMATAFKSAVILFIAKIFSLPFFEQTEQGTFFVYGLGVLSVLTALFGNLLALKQVKLKRLIAFSSLSHSGYLMMALVGIFSVDSFDFKALFYYLLAYIFMTGGAFSGIQCLEERNPEPQTEDLKGILKSAPFLALSLSFFLMSLAGIPPLFGFFAKLSLFKLLIVQGNHWLIFWALVSSALGLYYYIKPIPVMMQESKAPSLKISKGARGSLILPFAFTLIGGFFFGFFF